MTIAFFFEIFYPEINGVINSSIDLALNLIKNNHKIIFIAPKSKKFSRETICEKIKVLYLPSIPTFIYPGLRLASPVDFIFAKQLKDEKIDIVHITGTFSVGLFGIFFAKFYKIPVVHTFHTMIAEKAYLKHFFKNNMLVNLGRIMVLGYLKPFIKSSDVITAPSQYVSKYISTHFPGSRVIHITNGIDSDIFKSFNSFDALKTRYPQFNRKTFLFIGRLGNEKSVDTVIKAVYEALKTDNEIQLVIIGSGPDEKILKKLVNTLSIGDNIHFLGRMEHKEIVHSGLIHHARAFVTASKTETQCMTVMESMIAGIPIIIPDVPGIRELFGNNGRLFEADNIKELSSHILDIAGNDDIYHAYCKKSKELNKMFDGRTVSLTFEKVYRQLTVKKYSIEL